MAAPVTWCSTVHMFTQTSTYEGRSRSPYFLGKMTSHANYFWFFAELVIIILSTYKIICIAAVRFQQEFFKPHYPRSKTEKGIAASRIVI